MWNPRGGELFFLARPAGDMMSARVQVAPDFKVLRIDRLFNAGPLAYSVRQRMLRPSADGSRFFAMDLGREDSSAGAIQLVLIQNFTTELKRRLP